MKKRNLEWEVNELFPISDTLQMVAIGLCHIPDVMGVGPLITIDLKFAAVNVANCLTRDRLDSVPKEVAKLIEVHKWGFYLPYNDRTSLLIRTPEGGWYRVQKSSVSEVQIAWTQIREKSASEDDDEDHIPPSRLGLN